VRDGGPAARLGAGLGASSPLVPGEGSDELPIPGAGRGDAHTPKPPAGRARPDPAAIPIPAATARASRSEEAGDITGKESKVTRRC